MSIDKDFHGKLAEQLTKHEGLKLKPYHCPAGGMLPIHLPLFTICWNGPSKKYFTPPPTTTIRKA